MVLTLCGVGLSLQGWTLALLGGSLYYLSAGLLLIAVAVLLFRGKPEGAWLYGAFRHDLPLGSVRSRSCPGN